MTARGASDDANAEDWPANCGIEALCALHALADGDEVEAHRLYQVALDQFDGTGFHDKAFDGRYATYKLALALFTGAKLGVTKDRHMLDQLLHLQASDGGFAAHYTADGPAGDGDTRTTGVYGLGALCVAVAGRPSAIVQAANRRLKPG